jgi:anaerobic carbon-monoxide dehydrogenase iron sulfur subunit
MLKTLIVDAQKCSGCRTCESYCALKHGGVCNPALANIHVIKWERDAIFVPINCRRCEKPACEMVCPKHATHRNFATGAMEVDEARCIGCLSCVFACPFGATFTNPATGEVLKCDLCDGDPTCVKVCPCEALTYEEVSKEAYLKLVGNADKIPSLVREALGKQG